MDKNDDEIFNVEMIDREAKKAKIKTKRKIYGFVKTIFRFGDWLVDSKLFYIGIGVLLLSVVGISGPGDFWLVVGVDVAVLICSIIFLMFFGNKKPKDKKEKVLTQEVIGTNGELDYKDVLKEYFS